MNGIEKEQYNMLMVLLENGIIEETHYISEHEHVNTTEDVASELLNEYAMLVNGVDASQDQALNLADVSQQSELLIDFYMKSATQMGARNNLNIAREAVDLYIKGNL